MPRCICVRGPMPVRRYLGVDVTQIGAAGMRALESVGFPSVDDHDALRVRLPRGQNTFLQAIWAAAEGDQLPQSGGRSGRPPVELRALSHLVRRHLSLVPSRALGISESARTCFGVQKHGGCYAFR